MLPPIAALFRNSSGLLLRAFFFSQGFSELQTHLLDQLVDPVDLPGASSRWAVNASASFEFIKARASRGNALVICFSAL